MNLADITTKCYILALIIRDDGERLLLGDGAYEFKDSQQHFIANTYANDVVELQGTDGQMLAGQVRRTATQTFAGYIGDATFSKQKIEAARRDFLMFFRKKHYYTAVYVFSDGTAIQRDRGYIVNAPSVPELYQRFPEWSVGLNFEDPNYYEYAEDDLGQEIAAHKIELELSTAMSGGLIWDGDGAVSDDLSYVGTEIPGEGKNFQLADTGTATLKSAELLGDAEQTTYSGKNLLPMINTTRTINNVTFTPRADGSIALSGTASAQTNYPINVDSASVTRNIQLSAGTYTVSWGSNPASSGMFVQAYYTVDGGSGLYSTGTFTVSGTQATLGAYIRVNNGTNTNGTVIYPMIEKNNQATTYEPYVGGTASPNPDYPQAVNTVIGEQTVSVVGKNLLSADDGTYSSRDINGVVSNGELTLNGTSTGVSSGVFGAYRLIPAGTYTLSANNSSSETGTSLLRLTDRDGLAPTSRACSLNSVNATKTFTLTEDTWLAYQWRFDSGKTVTNLTIKPMLEAGSTATAYEPYQGQTKTVNLGKNLFDLSSLSATNITVNDNEVYGSASAFNTAFSSTGIVVPTSSQFTLSIVGYTDGNQAIENTSGLGFRVGYTDGTYSSYTYWQNNNTTATLKTFTSDGNKTPDKLYFSFASKGQNIWHLSDIQLELGSQATSYSAYFTPIELAKVGDYQDRIYKDEGKWYIHKEIKKITVDGSENWSDGSYYQVALADRANNNPVSAMSDHYTYSTSAEPAFFMTAGYLRIRDARASLAAFKTWLASNPTTVYYALETPTDTEITNIELIRQLERLRHAHTYADLTNFSITATSPNLPAFLKVVAFGDDAIPQGGYVWEDGGAGGATTITVDGVDNAQPIWTVVGPATNPSLTNITTGESIQWTGVVPNGQTLVVNMADMTASLSGANVFEFISGSWITLQAGNNRVSYSATAATGIATLEWNGVVG